MAKVADDGLRFVCPKPSWCRFIWKPYIPPSRSVHCWKVFHNRLPIDDKLIVKGKCLISVFRLCFGAVESM